MHRTIKSTIRFSRFFLFYCFLTTLDSCTPIEVVKGNFTCSKVSVQAGPEDFAYFPKLDGFFVSSADYRDTTTSGNLVWLDKITKQSSIIQVLGLSETRFRPHGISFVSTSTQDFLYVISHPTPTSHKIHKFEIKVSNKLPNLLHVQTFEDPKLTSPNDLFALEDGTFFVSNDYGTSSNFGKFLHSLFRLERADISFFDGKEFHFLEVPVAFGNGIFYYKDKNGKEWIHRSLFFDKSIGIYKLTRRVEAHPKLELVRKLPLESGPDNIAKGLDNKMYVTGHPSTFSFLKHARSKENFAPSEVIAYTLDDLKPVVVFRDDGSQISAASTAWNDGKVLWISQVFEPFLLECK